jgi:hypothetical protein
MSTVLPLCAAEDEVFEGLSSFSDALDRAVARGYDAQQVDDRGVRTIIRAQRRPLIMLLLRRKVITEALAQGLITDEQAKHPGTIDWNALLAFIQALLPIILAFLQALGVV